MTSFSPLRASWFSRFFNTLRQRRRAPQRAGPPARSRLRLEPLEDRWVPATVEGLITSTGTFVTHDETAGPQNSVVTPNIPGDANDDDVAVATLPSAFSTRLTTLTFDPNAAIGAAASNGNVITINGTGITDLRFTDANGDPLNGLDSSLDTTDGQSVLLYTDTGNNNIVLGKTGSGAIVFAIYLEETGSPVSGGKLWTVQYESLFHLDPNIPDDPDRVDLTDKLFVTADQALEFNFDQLASGASLFGAVGTTANAIVVIGEDIGLDGNGKYITNQTDDIKTSQGGDGATIGVDSQMFDPGEGAYFTYVTDTSVLGTGDNANSIQYGGTFEVTGASFRISQTQGNDLGTAEISAYNLDGAPDGVEFVNARGTADADNDRVSIATVRVYNAAGVLIEEQADGAAPSVDDPTVEIVFSGDPGARIATVSGLDDLYRVEWDTAGVHDQVLIKGVAGKFDIGRFGILQAATDTDEVGSKVLFEDDGPTAGIVQGAPTVAHDETAGIDGDADDTTDAAVIALFAGVTNVSSDLSTTGYAQDATAVVSSTGSSVGADEEGATTLFSLAVSAAGVDSGLDTTDGTSVLLFKEGDLVVGRIGDVNGAAAFAVAINSASGVVSTAQYASLKHPTGGNSHDEAVNITDGALLAVVTVTDGDGDTDTDSVGIGDQVQFQDDGPTAGIVQGAPTVAHDETAGIDGDADDTTDAAVIALFAGVTNVSSDLSTTGYAQDATAVVSSTGSSVGADEEGATTLFSLAVSAAGVDSGLDTTDGTSVLLFKEGDLVVGRIGDVNGAAAFAVAINSASGVVSTAQYASLKHPTGGNSHDEAVNITDGALLAVVTVTDGDGDTDTDSVGIGDAVLFQDDGPAIGPISDGLVDFAKDAPPVTNPLNGVVGADNPATYSVTSSPETVVIFDGTSAELTLLRDISADATVVTYFEDVDGSGTLNEGDTEFFKLTLSGGNYTFEVLEDPPPATIEFNFDQLESGASLFGAVGTTANALVVIGEDIGLDGNGKYITNQTDDIKTSQGGDGATIGVDSQMFDPGEGAYFTYVTDTSVLGTGDNANSIQYGGTFEVTGASFRISQTQGNDLGTAEISAYNLDGAPDGVEFVNARGTGDADNDSVAITAVRVYNAAGDLIEDSANPDPTNDVVVTITGGVATVSGLDDLYTIEWDTAGVHDQVLIKGVAGKFDIGAFAISQPQPTPDEKLDFTVQIVDADGDTATAAFSIGIDGTGPNDDNQVVGIIV